MGFYFYLPYGTIISLCSQYTTSTFFTHLKMKVWFGTTTAKLFQYQKYYFAIRDYLIESGYVIPCDWLDDTYKLKKINPEGYRDIKDIFQKCVDAIDESDFSVIEYTVPNFSSSHQIHYSMQKRKPVLVLRLHKDNSFADSYIEALESGLLTIKYYNLSNYKQIIDEFLGYLKMEKGYRRYNVVLDKMHKYYLDWAASKYHQSRSGIIRHLIGKEINSNTVYRKYIGRIDS